ncbi:Mor transcription activator family protein [Levilactobacillus sp. HBUAS70063]|uniref:Mor transcription activator family protein n=1 Tax=Levilactobacillus sp. HBUAS70063 TaxID=3109359 RepID=UPI003132B9D8
MSGKVQGKVMAKVLFRKDNDISNIKDKGGESEMNEKVEISALHHFYRGLSELVGVDSMLKIYQQYKGMQMTIPTHLYDRNLAAKRVRKEYTGRNQQELARKYGYSQKWIRQVARENENTNNHEELL